MDNPPAFPTTKPLDGWGDPNQGMTLRDWFAGQALASMSADLKRGQEYGTAMRELASKAYVIADAMLAARTQATDKEMDRG